MFERTSVGLDVHARSVVGCAIDNQSGEVFRRRLGPGGEEIRDWVASLPGTVKAVYEAGPTGFALARFLLFEALDAVLSQDEQDSLGGDGNG